MTTPDALTLIARRFGVDLDVVQTIYAEAAADQGATTRSWPPTRRRGGSRIAHTLTPSEIDPGSIPDSSDSGTTADDPEDPPDTRPAFRMPRPVEDRYAPMDVLGRGGMGEILRVWDRELERPLAMKIARPVIMRSERQIARFLVEAQITAQLAHPGIVPVHELGRLPDGRIFFTMKEIQGETLEVVTQSVHDGAREGSWCPTHDGWTFRRLIDVFRRVCETMAHAHARGVIHRDLKPANIMVGPYGEVLVLDWGLAKAVGAIESEPDLPRSEPGPRESIHTRIGTIAGTPAYMPPEQAAGRLALLDARSDVYSLGAILYEILCGHAPYTGVGSADILDAVRAAGPAPIASPAAIPTELRDLCELAMSRDAQQRPANAEVLASEIQSWQEGARRRERALELVRRAREATPELRRLRQSARELASQAARSRGQLRPWQAVSEKRTVWELEDEARRLEEAAESKELEVVQLLQAALVQAPDLRQAQIQLAALYRSRHADAESQHEQRDARRYLALLAAHDTGEHSGYIDGRGTLTLRTAPVGAVVEIAPLEIVDRRLCPGASRALGRSPLSRHVLPMGGYLLTLRHPDRAPVRYPVHIGRQRNVQNIRPDRDAPHAVYLPRSGEIGSDAAYVPAGYWWCGGDREAPTSLRRQRIWTDGFAIQRRPVTNGAYLRFLNDLVARGQGQTALRMAPRERASAGTEGAQIYQRDAGGRFVLGTDLEGHEWLPDYPVLLIDWFSARAYAAWYAERTGQPWRLPGELEWEKAARGVDGRFFPWGDHFDPTWACLRESHRRRMLPATVSEYPDDVSIYGMEGAAGNAADWCADPHAESGRIDGGISLPCDDPSGDEDAYRVVRGGAWCLTSSFARLALRRQVVPQLRSETIGFRLARTIDAPGGR